MRLAVQISFALSVILFLYYGLSCLFAGAMFQEFERFNLQRFRRLTGLLEVLGALGLLGSYFLPPLVFPSAAGLSLLMLLGIYTRLRVRDPLVDLVPAGVLLFVNLFLVVAAVDGVRAGR